MGTGKRIVTLTVSMVVLAGVLSGAAALWHTLRISSSYHEIVEAELEEKGLVYGQVAMAFVNVLGPDALAVIQTIVNPAPGEAAFDKLEGIEAWSPDASAPGGYRLVFREELDGAESPSHDDQTILRLVAETRSTGSPAAAVDEEDQHIHVSLPISLDENSRIIVVGTLSAEDEFAFFEGRYRADIRNGILVSAGIIAFVSVLGAGLAMFVSRDLTSRRRVEQALREQTRRDPLTGVLNHAAIVGDLRGLLDGDGGPPPCAVAMVDVDGMKATNDTFGHQVGDQVLLAVAGALDREGALLGRYGGDEFVAILQGTDRAAAERYRAEVVRRLGEVPLVDSDSGLAVPVSVSMGLAIYPEEAQTVTDLLKLSDNAMYASRLRRPLPRAREAMPRRRDEQAAKMVGEMVPLLTSEGSLSDKLRLVTHRLCVGAGYDAVNFELLSPETGELLAASSFGFVPEEQPVAWERHWDRAGANRALIAVVERTLRPLIVNDADSDARVGEAERALLRGAGLRSLLIAPMCWQERLAGLLTVLSKKEAAFGPRDAQFVTAVATQVTAIARMAMLLEQLQSVSARLSQSHEETILLLAASAEAHDANTGRHLHSVRNIAEVLALELGHSEAEAREIALAATLHDIGKIRVPDEVLATANPLTPDEWAVMKQHTTWGGEFLSDRPGFELAATIARSHHERWDGSGYPDGLTGEAIPEAAAITAVADAFDAITGERSYRSARSLEQAVAELRLCSGTQFSPRVVEALLRLQDAGALARLSGPDADQRAA